MNMTLLKILVVASAGVVISGPAADSRDASADVALSSDRQPLVSPVVQCEVPELALFTRHEGIESGDRFAGVGGSSSAWEEGRDDFLIKNPSPFTEAGNIQDEVSDAIASGGAFLF